MRAALLIRDLSNLMNNNGLNPSSLMRSRTPVVSRMVSTKRIVRFAKGDILLRMLSIELWLIWDVMVKKNLLPLDTSLSTHMLPCMSETRRFEIERPKPVPPYSYILSTTET